MTKMNWDRAKTSGSATYTPEPLLFGFPTSRVLVRNRKGQIDRAKTLEMAALLRSQQGRRDLNAGRAGYLNQPRRTASRWLFARRDGRCVGCRQKIHEGDRIYWDAIDREARCEQCGPHRYLA